LMMIKLACFLTFYHDFDAWGKGTKIIRLDDS
jgi:hypothetical protein